MSYHKTFRLDENFRQIQIEELVHEHENKVWVNAVNKENETPLHISAKSGNLQLFKSLLPYYTNIETTDNQGNTVLHILADSYISKHKECKYQRINLFCILASKGANVNKQNKLGWTPIHYAAKYFQIDMLKIAQMVSANFNSITITGETPLLLACKNMLEINNFSEATKTINFLIKRGCDINNTDNKGYSALHYSVEKCNLEAINTFLHYGADINFRTSGQKLTPLHIAINKRNLNLVKALYNAGAVIESQEFDGITPLHMALIQGSSDIVEYLIDNSANINHPDKILKFTPLNLTIYQQRFGLFQLLLHKGADVDGNSESDLNPLQLSSMLGSLEFTRALINRGAKVNCRNKNLLTPLHLAVSKSHLTDNFELEGADAIRYGHEQSLIIKLSNYPYKPIEQDYKAVIWLLMCNGSDVNAVTSSGLSSLHLASKLGQQKTVEILLESKANVNLKEFNSGFTALHFASENNFEEIIKLLIDFKADVNAQTSFNQTPLHLALSKKHTSAAKILINAGADVNALTHDSKSPMHFAAETNCMDILRLLIKRNGNPNQKQLQSQVMPLHLALKKMYIDAAIILIDAGADVNSLTDNEKSPLHLALESNNKQIINYLINKGAKLICKRRRCLYTLLYLATQNKNENAINDFDKFGKTPLLSAICSDEKRDIKVSIFRLAALIDTWNVNDCCMPRNSDITKYRIENFECLIDGKVNPFDFEAYSKFVFYRVLSGAFHEFSNVKYHYEKSYIFKFLCMLNAIKLPLANNFNIIKPDFNHTVLEYEKKCIIEVQKLMNYSIVNSVTLYNLIHMRPRRRRFYMRNLNLNDIKNEFKIYYKLILAYYNEVELKTIFIETFHWAFYKLTNLHFPVTCVDEIFWNLNIIETLATIQAAEGIYQNENDLLDE